MTLRTVSSEGMARLTCAGVSQIVALVARDTLGRVCHIACLTRLVRARGTQLGGVVEIVPQLA